MPTIRANGNTFGPSVANKSRRAVEHLGKPTYDSSGGRDCVFLSHIFPTGVVGDGSPTAHIFRIAPELLESERAVGPSENVNAAIHGSSRRACQDRPARIQSLGHGQE